MIQSMRATYLNKKIGRFKVSKEMIDTQPDWLMVAMQNMLVKHVEYNNDTLSYVYTVICEQMRSIDDHEPIPWYNVKMRVHKGQEVRTLKEIK